VILKSDSARPWPLFLGVAFLAVILILELALSVRQESQTWDEACHIYAGYSYWTRGDFGMNPEHPPLVKLLATLPLLRPPLWVPTLQGRDFKIEAFLDGRDFLYSNDAGMILFRTRMAAAVLTLLLALLVFGAAYEMFGSGTGLLALFLLTFEPTLLAHGALVTTDMGVTCFLFATVYTFYRYCKQPSVPRLVAVGLAAGLALASKHSAVLVAPVLILLALFEVAIKPEAATVAGDPSRPAASKGQRALRLAGALVATGAIAFVVLWSVYGLRFQMRPDGLRMSPPLADYAARLKNPSEAAMIKALARWHVFPEAYLYGLTDVQSISESSSSYLFGKVYPEGQWFYFPAALVIKLTLPVLLFLLLLPVAARSGLRRHWRKIVFLVIPAASYFLVAMASGLNIGVRHVLPVFPFLLILSAASAWALGKSHKVWSYAVVALLIFHAVSSLRAFPVYLAYSNEIWGGPANTYNLLTDSNVDWGQQLYVTARYLNQHGIKDCWFAYFADVAADPAYYGVPCKPLTTISSMWLQPPPDVPPTIHGTVLVSAGVLSGYEFGPGRLNPYAQFQTIRPTAVIEDGVFVFHGRFDISLASALNHVGKVWHLASDNRMDEALAEARAAVAIAPDSVRTQTILGDMLMATHQPGEARLAYQRALALTQSLQPEYQKRWADTLRKDLAGK
jgi:4-amino-4-deoxy-L-arabinose transferase-like glycosyltransferase